MRKKLSIMLSSFLLFSSLTTTSVFADETAEKKAPFKPDPIPNMAAPSAIVINADTSEVLMEKDADKASLPASLTKLMTLSLVSDQVQAGKLKLRQKTVVSEKAWRTQGSKMWIEVGKEVSIENLYKGTAVVSGNDAAVALAEHVGGSTDKFVGLMNEKAKHIGMKNTTFQTVNGLPIEGKYDSTTARDMATLAQHYWKETPENLFKVHSMKEFAFDNGRNTIKQPNNNPFIGKDGVVGLKTGTATNASKQEVHNLILTAERNGKRLIAVVMGAPTKAGRDASAKAALEYGFNQYTTVKLGKKGDPIDSVAAYMTKDMKEADLVLAKNMEFTVLKRDEQKIKKKDDYPDYVLGGLKKGDSVGKQIFTLNGKVVGQSEVVVNKDLEKAGIFQTFFDSFALLFHKALSLLK